MTTYKLNLFKLLQFINLLQVFLNSGIYALQQNLFNPILKNFIQIAEFDYPVGVKPFFNQQQILQPFQLPSYVGGCYAKHRQPEAFSFLNYKAAYFIACQLPLPFFCLY